MLLLIKILLCCLCSAYAARNSFLQTGWNKNQKPNKPEQQQRKGQSLHSPPVQQEKQFHSEPLAWRYPDPPEEEKPLYPPHFELKVPVPTQTVSAICGESTVRVEAKKDLLGIGKPVLTKSVTLGGCEATGEDLLGKVIIFESQLHDCGSQLVMSEDYLSYIFTLLYTPTPLGDGSIVRGEDVAVQIECQYPRRHDVSSAQIKPTWIPFTDREDSEESLYFKLQLMTDDWQLPRPSHQFLLGDVMKFEVSVKQYHHVPLRVTVDSCVATIVPNIDTVPRYSFLGNRGCLFDSQLTGSSSKFLPRTRDDKLQFEVEAFRFEQDHSGLIYVTCSMKATAATAPVSPTNKACSFSNGWREASGIHHTCSCCDTDCDDHRSDLGGTGPVLEWETNVGPLTVKERPLYKGKY